MTDAVQPEPAAAPDASALSPVEAVTTAAPGDNDASPPSPPRGIFAAAGAPDGRPEGLPDQFWDQDKKEVRLGALVKAVNDLRARVARGHDEALPDSIDAYALPAIEGLPPEVAPATDDPVWRAVRQAAREAGVAPKQLEAIARPYLAALAEQAKQRQPDPARAQAAYETELTRLGPHGRRVVQDVGAWLNGLVSRGVLTQEELGALEGVSTADGVRALAKLRTLAGEKPIPLTALDDSRMSYADAQRMMREAIERGDEALGRQAEKALRELAARGMIPGT